MIDTWWKNIVIVEGFEMVGKTSSIRKLLEPEGYSYYHPDHSVIDVTLDRNKSWTIGYGIIDMLSQSDLKDFKVIIDRGVASSYVYGKLYGEPLNPAVIEWYRNSEFFKKEVSHVLYKHTDMASARKIYEKCLKDRPENPNKISAQYDVFSSFDAYYIKYLEVSKLFDEAYNLLEVNPRIIYNQYKD